MADAKLHARLSPSGAAGWMTCPGWRSDSKASKYSAEGTAAHELGSWCLTEKRDAVAYLGRIINVEGFEFEVDDDMAEHVQTYVDKVREYAGSVMPDGTYKEVHTLLVEQAVPVEHVTGEEGATGTSDAIVITADGDEVQAHDLKFGQSRDGIVYAEKNPQLALYNLGAREVARMLGYEPTRFRFVIHQPRLGHLSEWDCTSEGGEEFAEEASAAAETARQYWENPDENRHNPGQKQCRWCSRVCQARENAAMADVLQDFEDLEALDPPAVAGDRVPDEDARLDALFPRLGFIEDFVRAARSKIETRLLQGATFSSAKLVVGKKGNRKWDDAEAAAETLKSMRLKTEEMYTYKLISPAAAERLLKKESPKRWERLREHITQSDGGISVAPATDPRPAYVVDAAADDFDDLEKLEVDNAKHI